MAIFSIEPRIRTPKLNARHGLGLLALGALITGAPALAAADASARKQCGPGCQHHQRLFAKLAGTARVAPAAISVPPTATSALALLAPAALPAPASTLIVTTPADVVNPGDGQLSLREALAIANGTAALDAIGFAPSLEGRTLVLTGGQLTVSQDLIIEGGGAGVTIGASPTARVLEIGGVETDASFEQITISGGAPYGRGGGILLDAGNSLRLRGCRITGNRTGSMYSAGGAIYAQSGSRLTIEDSLIDGNSGFPYDGGISGGNNVTLVVRNSILQSNGARLDSGAIFLAEGSSLVMEDSVARNNGGGFGGALLLFGSTATISRSTISGNSAISGGGIAGYESRITLIDSSVVANTANVSPEHAGGSGSEGGGIGVGGAGELVIRNSTITGNLSRSVDGFSDASGGGISVSAGTDFTVLNSIVAGNRVEAAVGYTATGPDIAGTSVSTNGHNVFGSTVAGSIASDRENVAPHTIFATIDPATGGGKLDSRNIVPLKKNLLSNPALSGADPLTASTTGQLGTILRPSPASSLPDIGAVEAVQPLSTSPTVNNDVITGSSAANNLSGLAGNDLLKGLAGHDTLNAGPGSDVLDGGPGNNKLNGGTGVDLASFAFSPVAVVVDLSGSSDTARRGGATDTLTSIEGAIGTAKADSFKGDAAANAFQGGLDKDTMTGGGGRDSWDFDAVADSPASASRDIIKDFTPGQDVIDLAGIDADATLPGDQSFRWVGKAVLTGAAELGYYVSGGNTTIRASTDADAAAEFSIRLTGVKVLSEADFRP